MNVQEQARHMLGKGIGSSIGWLRFTEDGEGESGDNWNSWRDKMSIDWATIHFGPPGALEVNPDRILYPFGGGRRIAAVSGVNRIEAIYMDFGTAWLKVCGTLRLELVDPEKFYREMKEKREALRCSTGSKSFG